MKEITDYINIPIYTSRLYDMYFGGKSFAVFDIETTGLSPVSSKVILTGLLTISSNGTAQVKQFFADQTQDEEKVIRSTIAELEKVDYVITYNGRHFDIPFMKTRAAKYGLAFPSLYNLDLYLLISGFAPFKEVLPGLKQKNIEFFMGLSDGRNDLISGKESVELYQRYMESHSFELERKILLHNHDDIIQLYKILPIIEKLDLHKALFKRGFPAGRFLIEKMKLTKDGLSVQAMQTSGAIDYISFPTMEKPYHLSMQRSNGTAVLSLPCETAADASYIDAAVILGDFLQRLNSFPAMTNGYLILKDKEQINEMEINRFIKLFFEEEVYAI